MRHYTLPLTSTQSKALAIVPKIVSVPSFFGSYYIIQHVVKSPKRRKRVYHRLLLLMGAMDILFSIWTFLSTWSIPRGTQGVHWALGTTTSCTITGFIGHGAGLCSIMYNGSLTMFFLLTVRYGWKEQDTARIEPLLHGVPIVVGWGTAIAGIPLTLFNSIGVNCWIAGYPLGCKDSIRNNGQTTCTRGDNAWVYRWAFYHAWLWTVYAFAVVVMIVHFRTIRSQEIRQENHRNSIRILAKRKSLEFAEQAIFLSLVFCLTWVWSITQWILDQRQNTLYTPILFLQTIFVPLQGFFDTLVYIRPRYINYRKRHPEFSFWQILNLSDGGVGKCRSSLSREAETRTTGHIADQSLANEVDNPMESDSKENRPRASHNQSEGTQISDLDDRNGYLY